MASLAQSPERRPRPGGAPPGGSPDGVVARVVQAVGRFHAAQYGHVGPESLVGMGRSVRAPRQLIRRQRTTLSRWPSLRRRPPAGDETPPFDPMAVDRAYLQERARRRARTERPAPVAAPGCACGSSSRAWSAVSVLSRSRSGVRSSGSSGFSELIDTRVDAPRRSPRSRGPAVPLRTRAVLNPILAQVAEAAVHGTGAESRSSGCRNAWLARRAPRQGVVERAGR